MAASVAQLARTVPLQTTSLRAAFSTAETSDHFGSNMFQEASEYVSMYVLTKAMDTCLIKLASINRARPRPVQAITMQIGLLAIA